MILKLGTSGSKVVLRCLLVVIIGLSQIFWLPSCSDNNGDGEPEMPDNKEDQSHGQMYNILANTTWRLEHSITFYSNGTSSDLTALHPDAIGQTITFSTETEYFGNLLTCSYYPGSRFIWLDNEGDSDLFFTNMAADAWAAGSFKAIFGAGPLYVDIKEDQMILRDKDLTREITYRRVNGIASGSGSGSGIGSGTPVEPDVDFYDYTQVGNSSAKIDFIIYNVDEIGVKSAQIKYGTNSTASSSASTNLMGKHVIANINGLKTNTDYYIKCTLTYDGGRYTTPATRIRLSEW